MCVKIAMHLNCEYGFVSLWNILVHRTFVSFITAYLLYSVIVTVERISTHREGMKQCVDGAVMF